MQNLTFEALNSADLLVGLKEKYDTIIIKGGYCQEIYDLVKSQSTEHDLMGYALDTSILIYAITSLKDIFVSSDRKTEKDIEKKLKLYEVADVSKDKLTLKLR
ncbi:hypothetical protein QJS64_10725 [Paraclostridium bifermentans]|uniref:Uncharacterized protein n=1 Tax=Paraclostridium bifermentans TaxID=1490 RepID=A0ABY8QZB6_PARBF|nr:hypothetical protein QJS64_10725 [Paraclostridium bifermentans]